MIRTNTQGEKDLPRYFEAVFKTLQRSKCGTLDITLPDGRIFRAEAANPEPRAEVAIHHHDAFARLIRDGDLGFSDAYLEGWWSTPDLQGFMDYVHADLEEVFDGFPAIGLVRLYEKLRFWLHSNTKRQARKNIEYHYDLGNEFYGKWLDPSMTYSSAFFQSEAQSLEEAQYAKYQKLLESLEVSAGDHILEIGSGWGGFAEYAATHGGVKVTGLTISPAQLEFATARIKAKGLDHLVEFKLLDYRDIEGRFDAVASIEMFEAVGERFWPIYFQTVERVLRPGGKACFQIITVTDTRWHSYRKGVDFIQKYIFPGGMLPAPTVLENVVKKAGLAVEKKAKFGKSYAKTLKIWYQDFNAEWEAIRQMGFDERFRRMWNFYLTSCASTFDSGNCDVVQWTVRKLG